MAETRPTGVVGFLFTDVEGSVAAWESHPEEMRRAQEWHDARVRAVAESHDGYVFATAGDGVAMAFAGAAQALDAALELQRSFSDHELPGIGRLRVRMAIHAGQAHERDGDYFGPVVNRVARIMELAGGGQLLLSAAVRELVQDRLPPGCVLRDTGDHRLRGMRRRETIYQVEHPDLEPTTARIPRSGTGIPSFRTSFRGREQDVRRVRDELATAGVTTLVGPGGVGKTRLALEVAADLPDTLHGPAVFVDLAVLSHDADVAEAVAAATGIRPQQGRPIIETLAGRLPAHPALLVLDNCEHVLAGAARVADRLLAGGGDLRVLATSRQPLGIPGERTVPVAPLSVEGADPASSAAVALFLDRVAEQGRASGDLDPAAVAELCAHLDGVPLAIEMAAARIGPLTVEQIIARLGRRLDLLASRDPTVGDRHATLRATVRWSYDLLAAAEQAVFRRLGVFAGVFDVEAAEQVAAADDLDAAEVLPALLSLHEISLLSQTEESGQHRLLETVRALALELLDQEGETAAARDRHLAFVSGRVAALSPEAIGPDGDAALAELLRRNEDRGVAVRWALERRDPAAVATLYGHPMRPPLTERGAIEMRRPVLRALELPAAPDVRARLLHAACALSWLHGEVHAAHRFGMDCLAACADAGVRPTASMLGVAALAAAMDGEPDTVREAVDVTVAEGPRDPLEDHGWFALGFYLTWTGRPDEAAEVARRTIAWARDIGSDWIEAMGFAVETAALVHLEPAAALARAPKGRSLAVRTGDIWQANNFTLWEGYALLRLGRPEEAAERFAAAISGAEVAGNLREAVHGMEGAAAVARRTGDPATAVRLLELARRTRTLLGGHPGLAVEVSARERAARTLRELLGEEGYEAVLDEVAEHAVEAIFASARREISTLRRALVGSV